MIFLRKKERIAVSPPLSIRELLLRRGIAPDARFHDYQDYIEKKQKKLKTEVVDSRLISARGNVHLALGEIIIADRPSLFGKFIGWILRNDSR